MTNKELRETLYVLAEGLKDQASKRPEGSLSRQSLEDAAARVFDAVIEIHSEGLTGIWS